MIKKIMIPMLLLFMSFLAQGQITLTTTSNSATWSPTTVTNTGDELVWTAAANADFNGDVQNANDPTFDFSLNVNNQPIVITITNASNDFSGLTAFDFWNDNGVGSEITDIDLSNATALTSLNMRYNRLSTIDISQNIALQSLILRGNRQLDNQTLDTSNNTQLTSIQIDVTGINNVDFSNNDLLTSVLIDDAKLTTAVLDKVVIDLDQNGQSGGTLQMSGNYGTLGYNSYTAYNNLEGKGWTIDLPAPPLAAETITLKTTSSEPVWHLGRFNSINSIYHWRAEYENTGALIQEFVDVNNPTFDFSSNTSNESIIITITSDNGFDKLDEMSLYIGGPSNHQPSAIYEVDVSNAGALERLYPAESNLSQIDVSQNINLDRLLIHGSNTQLASQPNNFLDVSSNSKLQTLFVSNTTIQNISSLLQNPLLTTIDLSNSQFPSGVLDQVLIDLDQNGLDVTNITPDLRSVHITFGTNPGLTSASYDAYNNLIGKNWTIDVPPPAAPADPEIDIQGNGVSIVNGDSTPDVADHTDFGQAVVGQTLSRVFTIHNTGVADLNLTGTPPVSLGGLNSDLFGVFVLPQTPVAANGTTTFEIIFNGYGNTPVVATTIVSIANNDPDEDPYTFTVKAEAIQAPSTPDIDIQGKGFSIVNGDTTPSTVDDTDFGQTAAGTVITKTFTIQNLGSQPLDLTGTELVAISGTNAADFTISALPTTPIAVGANTTFDVTFNANSLGVRAATLTIASNDPNDPSYVFHIQAESTQAAGPEINVTSNNVSIPNNNTPIIADNTDFGQVQIGSPVTHTFTIENLGDSDLEILGNKLYSPSGGTNNSDFAITSGKVPPGFGGGSVIIAPGSSHTFEVEFNPVSLGTQDVLVGIESDDADEQYYFVNLTAEGIPANSGTIDVQGNGISIVNGDTTPDVTNDTDFGLVLNNTTKTTTYTIFNNHATESLIINSVNIPLNPAFQLNTVSETLPFTILPGGNITFDVDFSPTSITNYSATVEINNSESAQNPFQYIIAGQGADVVPSGDIMITQYYEGTTDSKWIEIKNISGAIIPAGTYFLALYDQNDIANIETQGPTASEPIPAMAIDDVLLFRNTNATTPNVANMGPATQITTAVCNFDGINDVILISSSDNATCYASRQDIIGDVPQSNWGNNVSFIRGGDYNYPEADFNINHWILLSIGADVDVAIQNTNIALGTQDVDIAVWNGAWSNSILPDKTRNVEINSNYDASNGTFTAGNLTVNSSLNLNSGTTNSVIIYGNLTISGTGSFIIGDQESLVMYNGVDGTQLGTVTGHITKLESSSARKDQWDVTYWSSPIENANISSVFVGVDPNRIYYYDQSRTSTVDPNDPSYYDVWVGVSGSMLPVRGYAADGLIGSSDVHHISFTGKPNNGPQSIELKGHFGDLEVDNDYNLIGNPYPSAIDIDRFLSDNIDIEKTIHLWTHNTPFPGTDYVYTDYVSYNFLGGGAPGVTKNIGSSQGFMVRATSAGRAYFKNSMRMKDANNQFYKGNKSKVDEIERDRIWLKIGTDQGGVNQLLIGFVDKATEAVDNGYDSKGIWGVNTIDFFSDIDGENYVIQGLPPFTGDEAVDLGFTTRVAPRMITVSINKMEGQLKDVEILLTDNLLGITHDLKQSDYTFEQIEKGEFKKRFTIQFKGQALDVDDDIFAKNEFLISNDIDGLRIRSAKEVKDIKVYDLLGRLIIQKQPNKKSFNIATTTIKNGTVLIVKATLDNGSVVSKKTIRY